MTAGTAGANSARELFREETEAFRERLPTLLAQCPGWYAVVKGHSVAATFEDQDDALKFGYLAFEEEPFMVELITEYPGIWRRG